MALARFFPLERCQLGDLLVGHVGKPLQKVLEVSARFDLMHLAVLDEREDSRVAHTGFLRSEEEPVFLADGRGANRVLDQIIIDFHFAAVEESADRFPLV